MTANQWLSVPFVFLLFFIPLASYANPINRQVGISENVFITVQNDTYGNEQRVCSIDAVTYVDGDSIPTSSPCEHCICRPPGFACTIISCEYRPGCKALKRSDQCCPEYQCECEKDGKIYQNGEKILDNNNPCEVCYCQGGDVICAVIDCYWRNDCQPRYIENRCCPLYDHCPPPSDPGPTRPTRPTIPTTTPVESSSISWLNLSSAVYETSSSTQPTTIMTTVSTTTEAPPSSSSSVSPVTAETTTEAPSMILPVIPEEQKVTIDASLLTENKIDQIVAPSSDVANQSSAAVVPSSAISVEPSESVTPGPSTTLINIAPILVTISPSPVDEIVVTPTAEVTPAPEEPIPEPEGDSISQSEAENSVAPPEATTPTESLSIATTAVHIETHTISATSAAENNLLIAPSSSLASHVNVQQTIAVTTEEPLITLPPEESQQQDAVVVTTTVEPPQEEITEALQHVVVVVEPEVGTASPSVPLVQALPEVETKPIEEITEQSVPITTENANIVPEDVQPPPQQNVISEDAAVEQQDPVVQVTTIGPLKDEIESVAVEIPSQELQPPSPAAIETISQDEESVTTENSVASELADEVEPPTTQSAASIVSLNDESQERVTVTTVDNEPAAVQDSTAAVDENILQTTDSPPSNDEIVVPTSGTGPVSEPEVVDVLTTQSSINIEEVDKAPADIAVDDEPILTTQSVPELPTDSPIIFVVAPGEEGLYVTVPEKLPQTAQQIPEVAALEHVPASLQDAPEVPVTEVVPDVTVTETVADSVQDVPAVTETPVIADKINDAASPPESSSQSEFMINIIDKGTFEIVPESSHPQKVPGILNQVVENIEHPVENKPTENLPEVPAQDVPVTTVRTEIKDTQADKYDGKEEDEDTIEVSSADDNGQPEPVALNTEVTTVAAASLQDELPQTTEGGNVEVQEEHLSDGTVEILSDVSEVTTITPINVSEESDHVNDAVSAPVTETVLAEKVTGAENDAPTVTEKIEISSDDAVPLSDDQATTSVPSESLEDEQPMKDEQSQSEDSPTTVAAPLNDNSEPLADQIAGEDGINVADENVAVTTSLPIVSADSPSVAEDINVQFDETVVTTIQPNVAAQLNNEEPLADQTVIVHSADLDDSGATFDEIEVTTVQPLPLQEEQRPMNKVQKVALAAATAASTIITNPAIESDGQILQDSKSESATVKSEVNELQDASSESKFRLDLSIFDDSVEEAVKNTENAIVNVEKPSEENEIKKNEIIEKVEAEKLKVEETGSHVDVQSQDAPVVDLTEQPITSSTQKHADGIANNDEILVFDEGQQTATHLPVVQSLHREQQVGVTQVKAPAPEEQPKVDNIQPSADEVPEIPTTISYTKIGRDDIDFSDEIVEVVTTTAPQLIAHASPQENMIVAEIISSGAGENNIIPSADEPEREENFVDVTTIHSKSEEQLRDDATTENQNVANELIPIERDLNSENVEPTKFDDEQIATTASALLRNAVLGDETTVGSILNDVIPNDESAAASTVAPVHSQEDDDKVHFDYVAATPTEKGVSLERQQIAEDFVEVTTRDSSHFSAEYNDVIGTTEPTARNEVIQDIPTAINDEVVPTAQSDEIAATARSDVISLDALNEVVPTVVHDEVAPTVVLDEVAPTVVHDEVGPTVVHDEVGPTVVHDEVAPTVVLDEVAPTAVSDELVQTVEQDDGAIVSDDVNVVGNQIVTTIPPPKERLLDDIFSETTVNIASDDPVTTEIPTRGFRDDISDGDLPLNGEASEEVITTVASVKNESVVTSENEHIESNIGENVEIPRISEDMRSDINSVVSELALKGRMTHEMTQVEEPWLWRTYNRIRNLSFFPKLTRQPRSAEEKNMGKAKIVYYPKTKKATVDLPKDNKKVKVPSRSFLFW